MLKQLSIAALALAAFPTLAEAQQRVPVDQYGRPVQAAPAQPQMQNPPSSQMQNSQVQSAPMQSQGVPMAQPMQSQPMQSQPMQGQPAMNNAYPSQAMAPSDSGGTMRDEYGNLYNSRGDRIDRSGRVIPPPVTPPGARALR
jgi:hypothetical protein